MMSQTHILNGLTAHRIEITNALDKQPDTIAMHTLAPYKLAVDSMRAPILGESAMAMQSGRPESLLSNFVADVLRESSFLAGCKADIGLCNMGGLRSSMPKGIITYGDVLEIAPFENRLCVVTLRGDKLIELMEQIAAVGGEGISGIQLVISKSGILISANIDGHPINKGRLYSIATLDYLAEGNDRMYALRDHEGIVKTEYAVRDVLIDYIRDESAQGRKIESKIEGRILVK